MKKKKKMKKRRRFCTSSNYDQHERIIAAVWRLLCCGSLRAKPARQPPLNPAGSTAVARKHHSKSGKAGCNIYFGWLKFLRWGANVLQTTHLGETWRLPLPPSASRCQLSPRQLSRRNCPSLATRSKVCRLYHCGSFITENTRGPLSVFGSTNSKRVSWVWHELAGSS